MLTNNPTKALSSGDAFRDWISADGSTPYPAVAGRYHLYVSLACPWASRTVIVRHLLGLKEAISMTTIDPIRDDRGWAFRDGPGYTRDPINGFAFLSDAYIASDPQFKDRVTVPVLWDKQARRIVNNFEDNICRMFNGALAALGHGKVDLFPAEIEVEHAKLTSFIYDSVNNGVYKAGFATSQASYEFNCRALFAALDELEARLATQRYLFGSRIGKRIVEADWRLFCTLVRFDAVYHGHFKCNVRRILDYPNLQGYLMDLYQQPGIAATVNFDHIKRHYYYTHDDINPTRIVPIGPAFDLTKPHGRDRAWRYSAWGKHPIEPLSFRCTIPHCDSMKKDKIQVFKDTIPFSAVEHKNPARRILVVDDDPDTRQLSVDVLVSSEYEVDAAIDGAAGWEALRAKHYDLVITDNKMPKMTGVELIEKLCYTRVDLPVIMATSQLPTYIFDEKPWLTPDAMLQRPFSNDDLLATVKKVLRTDDSNVAHMGMLLPKYL